MFWDFQLPNLFKFLNKFGNLRDLLLLFFWGTILSIQRDFMKEYSFKKKYIASPPPTSQI